MLFLLFFSKGMAHVIFTLALSYFSVNTLQLLSYPLVQSMVNHQKGRDASPTRRRPQRGPCPSCFLPQSSIIDRITVTLVASRVQKQNPSRPPRRSARLPVLPKVDEATSQAVEHLPAYKRRSLRPRPRPLTDCAASGLSLKGKKRAREDCSSEQRKRLRASSSSPLQEQVSGPNQYANPVEYWTRSGYHWPRENWSKKSMDNIVASQLLARKKSTGSLPRKRSSSDLAERSSNTPSDQKSREAKSAQYRDARYETLLSTKGSFMGKSSHGASDASKKTCRDLLSTHQEVPEDTMFRDDLFEEICEVIRNRNETRVIRDISQLIVPSAEVLAIRGNKHLRCLIESVNEGWNNSIPLTGTRPQPDYAVGFRREAFTEEQLGKLQPFVGELNDQSSFMATYYLYFPFLTCEIKCGAAALDVADRQNAHSMTLAVRAVVDLFRLVKRDKELNRDIIAFSISHDHRSVRIYGHYPVVEATKTTFYRHPIHTFDFTALEGKDKWTAYKFTKSVYNTWMPSHFKRLCSVIDMLPADLNFDLSQQSELHFSEQTGLSQDLPALNTESGVSVPDDESQLQPLDPLETPDTSFTNESVRGGTKKAKRGRS
jgi:hypothetical protein